MSPPAAPSKSLEVNPLEKSALDFLATHQKWADLTRDEIRDLRTRDFKLGITSLKKKNVVSDTYQRQLRFLHESREKLATLPKDLVIRLRAAQEEFAKLGDDLQAELNMTTKKSHALIDGNLYFRIYASGRKPTVKVIYKNNYQ